MKKIHSIITYSLLAVQLACTILFSMPALAQDADNLEAWAKMYEEMNQASGGEIEKLMKDMEQSGELDALMKELEQSGELDNILDAMIKSTPQEFMQNLEQEMQQQDQPSEPTVIPPAEPSVAKPTLPPLPVMQVDKSKLKQVQALLNSIVSKIATIKQKAYSKRAVQRELDAWEYNLTDLSYYLTTIQDETLAKYLQKPEFASFYDHLVKLERSLSIEEPRMQVEDVLEIEFEDPYMTLGFSASNISKAQAEKRYNELAIQKNPFAIKDKLKKQGLSTAEIDAQFKIAQKEFDKLFDAYKRIEQKETSSHAFLTILQALHTAIYKDMVIEDAKKLLREYDPEALRLKEAQEIKEKAVRDYKARVASQRPEFIPPVFDWPSFGDRKAGRENESEPFYENGDYQPKSWEDFDHESGRMDISKADKDKAKDEKKGSKDGDKKGDKDSKSGSKDGKPGDKNDGKKDGAQADNKITGAQLAQLAKAKFNAITPNVTAALKAIDAFVPTSVLADPQNREESVFRDNVTIAISRMDDITKTIDKDIETLGKIKEEKDKDKELKKYYEDITKYFDTAFTNSPDLKSKFSNVFGITDTKTASNLMRMNSAQKTEYFTNGLLEKFQNSYAKLAYAVNDARPSTAKKKLEKVTDVVKTSKASLDAIRATASSVSPQAVTALQTINKNLKDAVEFIEKNSKKPALKIVEARYKKDIKKAIDEQVTQPIKDTLGDIATLSSNPTTRSIDPTTGQPKVINVGPDNHKEIQGIDSSYTKLITFFS